MRRAYAVAASVALLVGAGVAVMAGNASATTYTYYVVDAGGQNVSGSGGNSGIMQAQCTSGDQATGGGVMVNFLSDSDYDQVVMTQSAPLYSGSTAYGWTATVTNNEGATRNIHTYVNCVHTES